MSSERLRILHLLASNKFSGAENVACQIISCFSNCDNAYCSPQGEIEKQLVQKGIKFLSIEKLCKQEVKRVLREFKPNIIHAHDAKASVMAAMCCKNIPIVSHIHCNDGKMSKLSIKSILFNLAAKKFAHIFFVSEGSLSSFRFKKSIEHKSSVLHNAIDTNKVLLARDADTNNYDFDIVFVGRLTQIKDPLRLVDIVSQVVKNDRNVKLGIVGDGEMRQSLQEYITQKNLDGNIKLLGFMSNPHKVISCAKVMLMTSISEGLPMCALEAMALGVPIISTKTDGLREIIQNGETGYLFDTNEEAETKILDLLQNKNSLAEMKKNVLKFSQEYNNLDRYKSSIEEAYAKAAQR